MANTSRTTVRLSDCHGTSGRAGLLLVASCAVWCGVATGQTAHFSRVLESSRLQNLAASGPASAANFGTVKVGATSAATTLVFTFDSDGSIGAPAVLTMGSPGLDFADAGTGTCTTNGSSHVYKTGDSCAVNVTFTPKLPGVRSGAAVLKDTSGKPVATAYVWGTGSGPLVNFQPGTEISVGSGDWTSAPCCFALDGAGDFYIATNIGMLKETPSGHGYTQTIVNINGRLGPMAIDGAGNFYITTDGPEIYKETPSAGGYIETTIGSGLSAQNSPTVDLNGNAFIADALNGRVLMEKLSGGVYTQTDIFDCGEVGVQSCPAGVAVDANDNVFITAYDGSQVIELSPTSGGGYAQSNLIGNGLVWPSDVVIDGTGNLYIADTLNSRIVKETLIGGTYVQSVVPTGSPINWPWAVAVDDIGNVYIADTYNNRYLREDFSQTPSLSFASTAVGKTSSDSPKTVTVENNGNAALTFPAPASGTNPSISTNFTLNGKKSGACPEVNPGGTSGTLAADQSCLLLVSYSPVEADLLSGTLALTDNALNAAAPNYATQTILLSAQSDGTIATETTINVSAAQTQQGQPLELMATVVGETGEIKPSGTVTFVGVGQPSPVVTLNGGVAKWSSSSLPAGSYSVTAVYSGDSNDQSSSSPAVTFAIVVPAQIVAVSGTSFSAEYGSGRSERICAEAENASGKGLPGFIVTFAGTGLKFAQTSVITDTKGQACTEVTGLVAGSLVAAASVAGVATPATFAFTVTPAPLIVYVHPIERRYGTPNFPTADLIDFNNSFAASDLHLNGAAKILPKSLQLTDGGSLEAASAYFLTPVPIIGFSTTFTFQFTDASADGMTFVLQNQSPSAIGLTGGNLGYSDVPLSGPACNSIPGISPSIAIKFDLFDNCGEGDDSTGLYTDGAEPTLPAIDMSASGINLHNGDVLQVQLSYDGQNLTEEVTDTVTKAKFTHVYDSVDLTAILGSKTAYAGFTAATGGATTNTNILTWSYSAQSALYRIAGLVEGDSVHVSVQTTATETSPPGVYPLTATVTGPALSNYTLTVHDSTLTVLPAKRAELANLIQQQYEETARR